MKSEDEEKIKKWINEAYMNELVDQMKATEFIDSFKIMGKQVEKMYNFIFGDSVTNDEGYISRTDKRISTLEKFKESTTKVFYKVAGGVTVGIAFGGTIVTLVIKLLLKT